MMTSPEFEAEYRKLNAGQKLAVDTIDGPVMVIAGPGTGKTQVLALRVGNILQKTDITPGNILCLTFTDAAAVNMRERLAKLIGTAGYKVAVHTFHGFAREVISNYPEYFYQGADFMAADDLTQIELLESVFDDLPRKDPLSSKHEDEYTYLRDAKRAIGLLKQAGLTPAAFAELITENKKALGAISEGLTRVFADRLSKDSIAAAATLADSLSRHAPDADSPTFTKSLYQMVSVSLAHAVALAHESEKTAPLSAWKEKWAKKDEHGARVLKDSLYVEKMESLARVYAAYRALMQREKYYDFDDMLLDVVEMLEENPALLSELEERFQYILVDEFQDTNDAQLALVRLMGSAPVNERMPNIMVVGDDDQAIYRFQGAEISNIRDFPKSYRDHTLVVLTQNYRSTQHILDVAREVIEKSEERLETALPMLEKKLIASRPDLGEGKIAHAHLPTRSHEYAYIAKEIARLIAEGKDPESIAIIARRHRELEEIARVLVASNIPITYERKQNVFDEAHVRVLVLMARFIDTLVVHGRDEADQYIAEILTAPFWDIPREVLWRLSIAASQRKDRTWLGAMEEFDDERIRTIGAWFIDLGGRAPHEPLERILDELIGSDSTSVTTVEEDVHEESVFPLKQEEKRTRFVSPFRDYYFGVDARKRAEARYLMFLSSLRVFIGALREFKHGKPLFVHDLVEFADMHERNHIPLADTTPFASALRAVNLMTAHKAKGLEFDTVFVVSCQEEVWAGRGFPNKLPFPMNLPIDIERDEKGDDRLRIFYVALTRAKRHLYVTSYKQDDSGKASIKVNFIAPEHHDGAIATHLAEEDGGVSDTDLAGGFEIAPEHPEFFPIKPGERAILMALVKDYRMSVTHLNNFLNVVDGGPATFLEQNLLHFPQAMSPNSSYGNAMHKAIEYFYRDLKRTGKVSSCEQLLTHFREQMQRERMTTSERTHFLHAGEEALAVWWEERGRLVDATHENEVDFKGQGVVVNDALLSGKIDKMISTDDDMLVVDFKTGKAKEKWEGRDAREKITLRNYARQLAFYKLLVEHSHTYNRFHVDRGVLEFLEPVDGKISELSLEITDEDAERLATLIGIVYQKIKTLDFPDISKYSKDVDGIIEFEEDLLSGAV